MIHSTRRADQPERAFTLVELLVVIAIVAAFIATLLPALGHLRRSAHVTADLANLRLLQTAMLGYATDHNGWLADARLSHGGVDQGVEESFVTTLKPWYDNSFALRSPLDASPHWPTSMGGAGVPVPPTAGHFRTTSYGLNDFLTHQFSPTAAVYDPPRYYDRLSAVNSPAGTVHMLLMTETGQYAGADHVHVEEWGPLEQAPAVASTMVSTSAAGGFPKSGDARSNWSFLDGHVATMKFNQTYVNDLINRFNPEVSATFDRHVGGAAASAP
ncbi:MAG: type II secretion system protein [Phycisphaerae bacterium]|nr:type II secretion system protein [Phycisphaerae bacterium]